ncbi:MAG: RNA methyltransferase [Bdellovibrionaceae bacterium]|nr:RNA methyltransferase [Bdellovibrio sp.]
MRNIDLRIVLVRSIYERNVGATSRAMANMGFSKLILVGPQCEFTIEANKAAANGQAAFENKKIYTNWAEFYEKEPRGIQIATTARDGKGRQVEDLETTLRHIQQTHPGLQKNLETQFPIHILFGPEDWGLSGEDIQYANHCCSIPTYGDNTSLNLSQATLLALFIFRSVFGGTRSKLEGQQQARAQQRKPMIFPDETLKRWLEEMNIDLSKRKTNIFTVLRRMLLQNAPSEKEFRMLEIVLQQSIRRMRSPQSKD